MKTLFLKPLISAPIDILLMLLGAFLIGFVIAWLLRNRRLSLMEEEGYHLQKMVTKLTDEQDDWEVRHAQLREELEECGASKQELVKKEDLDKALSDLRTERERSTTARSSLTEIESAHEALKRELDIKFNQMIAPDEATRLKAEANRLKVFNASLEEEITLLKSRENQATPLAESELEPVSSDNIFEQEDLEIGEESLEDKGYSFLSQAGIKSASSTEKDDLKLISGVGPFIEKKLNQIGLFTFEQIASLSPDQVEQVTQAIEFFPGRIQRDDWVGQANSLSN